MKKHKQLQKVFFSPEVKVLDEEQMVIDHCISDDLPDRVNDDIALEGWVLENYMSNPVVLEIHDYGAPPIGKALEVYTQGNQLRAKTQFAPTEKGRLYFQLYKDGFMKAFSVGFMALEWETKPKNQGYHYTKQELLEYSVVPVPCNPRALKELKVGAAISKANRELITQTIDFINQAQDVINQAQALLEQLLANEDDDTPDDTTPPDQESGDDGKGLEPIDMLELAKAIVSRK